MPTETTGADGTQADPSTQPQAGTDSPSQVEGTQTAQAAGATDGSGTGQPDMATLQRELAELRRSEARYRTENKRLTEAQKAADDATLSEQERIARRLAEAERRSTELEAELREQRLRSAVLTAAGRLSDEPEILLALLDRDAIEWAADGTPKGLERQLKAIVEAHPKLARTAPDFGGGQRGATPTGTDMNAFIRRAAGRTTAP
jgi:hypothetical protein